MKNYFLILLFYTSLITVADGQAYEMPPVDSVNNGAIVVQQPGVSMDPIKLVESGTRSRTPNQVPIANAGPDRVVADFDNDGVVSFTLDGSQSFDPGGSLISYQWKTDDETVLADNPVVSVTRELGTYVMTLTVVDSEGLSNSDQAVVIVSAAPATEHLRSLHTIESNQSWSGGFDSTLMGVSVDSAGDVNGDGFDDVIVGASGYDVEGGLFDEGAVFIFHGSSNGITAYSPELADAFIAGHQANGSLGFDVAGAGDINADGFDDVLLGAPIVTESGLSVSGAVYVFLGSAQGVVGTSVNDADFVLESKQIEGHMGIRVDAAGDVNNDGYDDIIVGAEFYGRPFPPPIDNQGSGRGGAAFVFLGSADGVVGNSPSTAHAALYPWEPAGSDTGLLNSLCWVSGAGDLNGDGYDDVMVGAPGWNHSVSWPGSGSDWFREGAVLIYYGSASGITGGGPSAAGARIEGDSLESGFGVALDRAGDINGDGYDDIIIGAPETTTQSPIFIEEYGKAHVFYGSPAGIQESSAFDAGTSISGIATADWLGRAVAGIGDINLDGYSDIAISARNFPGAIPEDGLYNGSIRLSGEGITYVFTGSEMGILNSQLSDATVSISSQQEAGTGGYDISAADTNADGFNDLVIGVPGYSAGEIREGGVFVWQSHIAELPQAPNFPVAQPIDLTPVNLPHTGRTPREDSLVLIVP